MTVAAIILALLAERAPKTACPSEVARALDPEGWRDRMDEVRKAAARLAKRGKIEVTQRGEIVDLGAPGGVRGPVRLRLARPPAKRTAKEKPRARGSSASDPWRGIDFRAEPERYRVGRGEEGVLTAEPYKSELLPLWRFRTPEIAETSARALTSAFRTYAAVKDFVGMDMARKFLQMGFTRARRYANHASGRKYGPDGEVLPREEDPVKAAAAAVFYAAWKKAEAHPAYRRWREAAKAQRRA